MDLLKNLDVVDTEIQEAINKELGQTHGVIVRHFTDDGDFLGLKVIECVSGVNRALERIKEADAEVVFVALGDVRVGRRNGNRRNFGFGKNRSAGHGQ